MMLPVSFDNIPSYKSTFAGDLIVTDSIIYFIPHTDLGKERSEIFSQVTDNPGTDLISLLWMLIGLVFGPLIYFIITQKLKTRNRSILHQKGLWRHGESSITLQSKLDRYVSDAKQQQQAIGEFSNSLPKPERFARDEVKNMSISAMGNLVFDAQYDRHDFKVGIRRRKSLREALKKAGFIR